MAVNFQQKPLRVVALLAAVGWLVAGCTGRATTHPEVTRAEPLTGRSEAVYQALIGELAAKQQRFDQAATAYLRAAELSGDPQAAERAVRFALLQEDYRVALQAAKRWAELRPDEPLARLALVRLSLRTGDIDKAIYEARQYLIYEQRGVAEAFAALTSSLSDEDNRDGAADVMASMAALYPEVPEAQYSLALLAVDAGRIEPAVTAIRKATAARPNWTEARVLQSRIALRAGNSAEAMAAVEQLVAENPQDSTVRLNYARMLVEQDRRDDAKAEFERVLDAQPNHPDALYILGLMALEDDQFDRAGGHFLRLVKTGQRSADAAFYLGLLAERQKQWNEAIGWYRQVNQGDSALRAQVRVAELLNKQGNTSAALNHLREIRANNAQLTPELLLAEADILAEAGRPAEALAIHNERVRAAPSDADALYARSLVREKLGDVAGAMSDLRAILKFEPDNPSALNALGYMLSNHSKRYNEALGYIQRALALSPNQPAIIDSYGWVLFRLGRAAESAKMLGRAHALFPDPEIAAHLGEVLWTLGQQAQAKQVWQDALLSEQQDGGERNDALHDTLRRLAPELLQ